MTTDGDHDLFVLRGNRGSAHGPRIVLRSQAYRGLIEATRARLPAETTGALVGTLHYRDRQTEALITGAVPVSLVSSGLGVAPSEEEWADLQARLASEASESAGLDEQIIGWFYADPGIGIFPPRIDVAEVHATLAPEARLFLLVNPSSDRGAFYTWRDRDFVPVGGFYEALEAGGEEAIIPWDGNVPGAVAWLRGQRASAEAGGGSGFNAGQGGQEREVVHVNRRRMRLVAGVMLGLIVAAALVGSLFLFGREPQVTQLPSSVETQTIGPASPIPTAQATAPPSLTQVPPTPVATAVLVLPTSVETSAPPVTVTVTVPGSTATATVAQPTVTPIQSVTYTVSSGDALSTIAERFNTTVEAIMAANNLDSTVIIPGQVLIIPTPGGPNDSGTATPNATPTTIAPSIPPINASPTEVIPQAVPSSISTAGSR